MIGYELGHEGATVRMAVPTPETSRRLGAISLDNNPLLRYLHDQRQWHREYFRPTTVIQRAQRQETQGTSKEKQNG